MENPWLVVDEEDTFDEATGTYMGVFTRSPAEIAASLPRPVTPFARFSSAPVPQINTKVAQESCSISQYDVESPVLHFNAKSFFADKPLISIF